MAATDPPHVSYRKICTSKIKSDRQELKMLIMIISRHILDENKGPGQAELRAAFVELQVPVLEFGGV